MNVELYIRLRTAFTKVLLESFRREELYNNEEEENEICANLLEKELHLHEIEIIDLSIPEKPEEIPVLVGTLSKRFCNHGYYPSEEGTPVYELKNLYQMMKEIEERIKPNARQPLITISSTGRLALKFPSDYSEEEKDKLRIWITEVSDKMGLPEFSVRGRYSNIDDIFLYYSHRQHGKKFRILKYKISLEDMEITTFSDYIGEEQ